MQRHELEKLSREELIAYAERLNVPRPRVLTQPELIDEIIARTARTDRERARSRGWLGKARDLLAKVIEQGLHLPDAARAIRTSPAAARSWPTPPPPLPTVTLAEIYAAQGHLERAVSVLDEVIAREPDHKEARELRDRFAEQTQRTRGRPPRATDSGRTEARGGAERAEAKAQEPAASEAAVNEAIPSEAAANEAIPNEAAANEVSAPQEARAEQATAQEEAAPATEAAAFAAEDEPSNVEAAEEVKAKSVETDEDTKTSSAETATESAAEAATETAAEAATETAAATATETATETASETATETAAETAANTAAEPPTEASAETSAEAANEAEEPAAERAVDPTPLSEPTREAPAVAAEDDGSGPRTERDEAAPPAAEAMPAEPTPSAEHGADATENAIEIDETVVDDRAIADLTERLRAQEETAQQEPAQQDTAQQDTAQQETAPEPAEEDLPETYDVDEVVAIAVDPETIYVYWEVRAVTLARALARRPSGRLALRIAAVSPSWDGPVTRTWEILVDALHGDRFIPDIPQGANVRVSVGWLDGGSFEPFAVGAEVASPRLAPSEVESREVGQWTPEIHLPASPVPLGRAPRASQGTWAPAPHGLDSPAPSPGAGPATSPGASAASPVPLSLGRPAPGLTALAPSGGAGPGIDRATRSAELTRSYFRTFAGNYIRGGASDQVRGGASDYVRGGASDYVRGGASDYVRGGASDLLWGGASDLARNRNF